MAKKSSLFLKLKPSGLKDLFRPKMLVVYAAFLVALYFLLNNLTAAEGANALLSEINPELAPKITGVRWVTTLYEQNGSKEIGRATLVGAKDKTEVIVNVSGEPAAAIQPIHIHSGSCPTPGAVVYPLNSVVNGQSVTTLSVKLADLQKMAPLAVNVHKSAAQIGVYVSCANLK